MQSSGDTAPPPSRQTRCFKKQCRSLERNLVLLTFKLHQPEIDFKVWSKTSGQWRDVIAPLLPHPDSPDSDYVRVFFFQRCCPSASANKGICSGCIRCICEKCVNCESPELESVL